MKRNLSNLFVMESPRGQIEIPLKRESLFLGRAHEDWNPDVDFAQLCCDFRVSKKHARLFFKDGNWWIEDLGSKHGTLVDGEEIKGISEPTKLLPGVPVAMGDSIWQVDPSNLFRKYQGDLIIEYQRVPAINFSLYQCGIPVISNLKIRNRETSKSPPVKINISIPGYSDSWERSLSPLSCQEEVTFDKIYIPLHCEKLEGREVRVNARLIIQVNEELITDQNEKMPILGFYHWPLDSAFRKSLACFVQPSHPVVQHIVLDAIPYLSRSEKISSFTHLLYSEREDRADVSLRAIYETLGERYKIHYVEEGSGSDREEPVSQEIRPPHRAILRRSEAEGQIGEGVGTCIDLTLLFASCLENIRLQPLIIFVKKNNGQHAFLGCWKEVTERFKPIIEEYEKLKEAVDKNKLLLIETTGVTDRWGETKPFEEAVKKAFKCFAQETFIFALDVAVARQTIPPLQFPMSPKATEIIRKAEELARKEKGNRSIEMRHLFYSFLSEGSEEVREVLAKSKAKLFLIEELIPKVEREGGVALRQTINYRRCIEDARFIAEDNGEKFVEEKYLFYALLLSQSKSVDNILDRLGTDRGIVKKIFEERIKLNVNETVYEPY